jgi:hypothetical protein
LAVVEVQMHTPARVAGMAPTHRADPGSSRGLVRRHESARSRTYCAQVLGGYPGHPQIARQSSRSATCGQARLSASNRPTAPASCERSHRPTYQLYDTYDSDGSRGSAPQTNEY